MTQPTFRFYAELNDYLPDDRRYRRFTACFSRATSIKESVERLGIPHTEIDLVLVNDTPVDFSHILRDGDRITVYPVFETLDISPVVRPRPHPLRETRFVVEGRLRRLARYLRALGFDTLWRSNGADDALCAMSVNERRILLTRDRRLVARSRISHGHWVRSARVRDQVVEVLLRFNLHGQIATVRRCPRCNTRLEPLGRDSLSQRTPAERRDNGAVLARCPSCDRQYGEGAHTERVHALIRSVTESSACVGRCHRTDRTER